MGCRASSRCSLHPCPCADPAAHLDRSARAGAAVRGLVEPDGPAAARRGGPAASSGLRSDSAAAPRALQSGTAPHRARKPRIDHAETYRAWGLDRHLPHHPATDHQGPRHRDPDSPARPRPLRRDDPVRRAEPDRHVTRGQLDRPRAARRPGRSLGPAAPQATARMVCPVAHPAAGAGPASSRGTPSSSRHPSSTARTHLP